MVRFRPLAPGDEPALSALAARAWTDVEATADAALGEPLARLGWRRGARPARAPYESAGFRRLPTAQYGLPGASPEPGPP